MNQTAIANFITMHHSQPYVLSLVAYTLVQVIYQKEYKIWPIAKSNNNNISEINSRPSSNNSVATKIIIM